MTHFIHPCGATDDLDVLLSPDDIGGALRSNGTDKPLVAHLESGDVFYAPLPAREEPKAGTKLLVHPAAENPSLVRFQFSREGYYFVNRENHVTFAVLPTEVLGVVVATLQPLIA